MVDGMNAPTPAEIVELALTYFAGAGIAVSMVDEGLTTEEGCVYGLEPLRRRLGGSPESDWTDLVGRHFDALRVARPQLPETFQEARPQLRSAVIAETDLGLFDGAIMERQLTDGLGERLMVKQGDLGVTVTTEVVAGWDVDDSRVWAQARQGSWLDEPVVVDVHRVGMVDGAYLSIRGGRWTSTRVLDLDPYLQPRFDYGAIVAIPERGEVLVHQIRNESFTDVSLAMLSHTVHSFGEAPLPVGCDLFWWSGSELARICTPGQKRFEYRRVPEFSAMLWRLEEDLSHRCGRRRTG